MLALFDEQRHVRVHARAVDAVDRLGHERRVQAVPDRHVLHDEPERADVVRRRQHIVVAEVDLVLAGRHLVVRRFDVKAHGFEREHDLAPHVLAHVHGAQVEIAGGVVRFGRRDAVPGLKQEELGLGPGLHRVAPGRRHRDDVLERRARAADEGRAFRRVDVADHPRDLLAGRAGPRKDAERRQVGPKVHVRLFDADESLDRRAVEHDLAVERLFELPIGDLDVLDRSEDVGELQAHELHLLALDALENLRLGRAAFAASGGPVRLCHDRSMSGVCRMTAGAQRRSCQAAGRTRGDRAWRYTAPLPAGALLGGAGRRGDDAGELRRENRRERLDRFGASPPSRISADSTPTQPSADRTGATTAPFAGEPDCDSTICSVPERYAAAAALLAERGTDGNARHHLGTVAVREGRSQFGAGRRAEPQHQAAGVEHVGRA